MAYQVAMSKRGAAIVGAAKIPGNPRPFKGAQPISHVVEDQSSAVVDEPHTDSSYQEACRSSRIFRILRRFRRKMPSSLFFTEAGSAPDYADGRVSAIKLDGSRNQVLASN